MIDLVKLPDLKKHERRTKRNLQAILSASVENNTAKFYRKIERYLKSYSARAVAADYVHRRLKEGERFPSVEAFQKAIEAVNLFVSIDDPVELKVFPKGNSGNIRLIMKFGFCHKVAQRVIDRLMREIGETHEEQFSMRGGVNAAVSHLKELLEGKEKVWVAHLDIQSAYGHVNKVKVEEFLPIHKRVLREYLTISDHTPLYSDSTKLAPLDGSDSSAAVEETANCLLRVQGFHGGVRSGLSQGAICSPIILEVLVARDLINLGLTDFSSFADNFCITAVSREQLIEKEKALRAAFKANPCGPFHLESLYFGEAKEGFDFLGHHLELKNGQVYVRPSDSNLQKIQNTYQSLMREYEGVSIRRRLVKVDKVERKFRQWQATYSQCTDFESVLGNKRSQVNKRKERLQKEQMMECHEH